MELVKANGVPFLAYYSLAWISTGALAYGGISLAGPDATFNALHYIGVDRFVDLSSAMSPQTGNMMSALLVNEILEPVRLPLVLFAVSKHKPKPRQQNPNFFVKQWYALADTAKTYGKFFLVYYTGVWIFTGIVSVATIEYLGADAVLGLGKDYLPAIDTSRFNPRFVNIGVGLAINEMIEPVRFPLGVLSVKPAYGLYQRWLASRIK